MWLGDIAMRPWYVCSAIQRECNSGMALFVRQAGAMNMPCSNLFHSIKWPPFKGKHSMSFSEFGTSHKTYVYNMNDLKPTTSGRQRDAF